MTSTSLSKIKANASALRASDVVIPIYVLLSEVFEEGSIAAKVARVSLVAAAILESIAKPVKGNLIILWQTLFVVFAAASIAWADSTDHAERMAQSLVINGICVVALVYLVTDSPLRLRLFLGSMIIAPTILMVRVAADSGLFVYMNSRSTDDFNANTVGMTAALGFGLAYLALTQKVLVSRWTASLFLLTNVAVVVLSASRKAIIMIALILILFSLLNGTSGGIRRLVKVATAVGIGLVGYWFVMTFRPLYEIVGHRLNTMINGFRGTGEVDASTATRLSLIDRGVGWFREKPWIGHGADNFRALMETYFPHQSAYYAHNNFVELLVDYGVVGFVLFYWMYVVVIVVGLRNRRRLTPTQSMVLVLMVTLLSVEYGAISYYSRVFMAFVGIAWVALCTNTMAATAGDEDKASLTTTPMPSRVPPVYARQ